MQCKPSKDRLHGGRGQPAQPCKFDVAIRGYLYSSQELAASRFVVSFAAVVLRLICFVSQMLEQRLALLSRRKVGKNKNIWICFTRRAIQASLATQRNAFMPHKTPLQYVHEQRLTSALRMVYLVGDKYTTVAEQTARLGCCLHSLVELLRLSNLWEHSSYLGNQNQSRVIPIHSNGTFRFLQQWRIMQQLAIYANRTIEMQK